MSMASVHPAELSASLDHLGSRSMSAVSLDDVDDYGMYFSGDSNRSVCGDDGHETAEAVLSIEELRAQLSSCFTCGVNWSQQHVSLDCSECGGYALDRPCPLCRAACGQRWKRDLSVSHTCAKARWQGVCPFSDRPGALQSYPACGLPPSRLTHLPSPCSAAARLATDLCQRLEQLSAQQRQS